ncbi:hypothetical protein BGZ95_006717 [Linnemannia exigua]|uniref:Uncharacterized protein n=1 Tax=Linnemannia exigua TaxID=604196 RepID=A0AAD4DHX6_9FUNG|nr:hypothetical protein BGZ95_006717 [Linnemannia exigua]
MESPHATPSESPFGVKPSSFFAKPTRVAPLNIATKQQQHQQPSLTASVKMMSPISFPSPLSSSYSTQTPRPSLSSQTFLEANVRLLCDMVDTILRTNESDQKMLRVDVSQPAAHIHSSLPSINNNHTLEPSFNDDPKSPHYILSPKSFTQAKSDISKLDDSVVSKLNSDTLLDLFPEPPPLPQVLETTTSTTTTTSIMAVSCTTPHLSIPILERPTTIVVSPTTSWSCPSEDCGEVRPRKGSKQHRNWVISSGLFVSTSETAVAPATESDYSHYKGDSTVHGSRMTETESSKGGLHRPILPPNISSPALPTTTPTSAPAAATVLPRPLVARKSLRQEKNHSSFSSTVGSLPAPLMTANLNTVSRLPISSSYNNINNSSSSIDTPCSAATAISPFSSMDALSQSLLNIEIQMRRPSFLMNRRTSILSTLFATNSIGFDQYDRQDQQQQQPSLSNDSFAVESAAKAEPSSIFLGVPKEHLESTGPLDALVHTGPEQAMDWRAWHGSWIRRRIKPEDDHHNSILSPTSPAPRSSYSSTRSSLLSPTSPVPRSSYSSTRSSSSSNSTSPNATLSPASTLVKRLSQRLRRPRLPSPISPTSSVSSPLAAFASSPLTPFYAPFAVPNTPTTPTKDANPELWENEGQKWGDRFQSLLNNFQPSSTSSSPSLLPLPPPTSSTSSNGKSSKKRWADILPKSRWNKWSSSSSSRTSSSSSSSARTSSESDRA